MTIFRKIFYYLWRLYCFAKAPCLLGIHIAEHCNLNCMGCNHYSPLAKPSFCDLPALKHSLSILRDRKVLNMFEGIDLIGGEPLLNPDIVEVFKIVRGDTPPQVALNIRLITNGLLLPKMSDSFWEACKEYDIIVGVTIYPIALDYDAIFALCKEKGVRYERFGDRTADNSFSSYPLITQPEDCGKRKLRDNYYKCFMQCMQLVDNRVYGCPQCAYSKYLNETFGTDFRVQKGDYLEIDNISKLKIIKFKFSPRPFCKYCKFPISSVDWKQSGHKAEEWIA